MQYLNKYSSAQAKKIAAKTLKVDESKLFGKENLIVTITKSSAKYYKTANGYLKQGKYYAFRYESSAIIGDTQYLFIKQCAVSINTKESYIINIEPAPLDDSNEGVG